MIYRRGRNSVSSPGHRHMEKDAMLRITVLRTIPASMLMISIALATSAAHAQETFECEDGGLVTVLPGQLELMKRTDPCVARHFQQPQATQGFSDYQQPYQDMEPGPVERPAPVVSSLAPADAPLPAKKPEAYTAGFGPLGEGFRSAEAEAGETVRPAAVEVKSDFRNVHIINGGSGPARFYQHTR